MADLDDFFAKKDRKKAKSGKKFTTTEEIARKLEETGKKSKLKEKPANPEGNDDNQQIEEEDEWKVFEEEKKDYSGLKIGNLNVIEAIADDGDDEKTTIENSSDQESNKGSTKQGGPWKNADVSGTPAAAPTLEPEPATKHAAQPIVTPHEKGGIYRPPSTRNAQQEVPLRRYRPKNVAPDINSEEYFPTLNSKVPTNDGGIWGKKTREGNFEEVRNRGGTRTHNAPETQSQAPKLSLGNKYDALSQDQS